MFEGSVVRFRTSTGRDGDEDFYTFAQTTSNATEVVVKQMVPFSLRPNEPCTIEREQRAGQSRRKGKVPWRGY